MISRPRRTAPIALALLGAILVTILVFRGIALRTDITDFLPGGDTPASRFMIQQLRHGATASLMTIGIENAPPADLARISRQVVGTLRRDPRFRFVAGGAMDLSGAEQSFLFDNRYLLSPVTIADAFTAPALHASMENVLRQLQSSAAPIAEHYGLADPPGAFLTLARGLLMNGAAPRSQDGAWFAADQNRALILARIAAPGMDMIAEQDAIGAVQAAFHAAQPGPARLLLSGPVVMAAHAATRMKRDVEFLSTLSSLAVALILVWRFRSIWVLAAIAVPVLLSLDIAALAVRWTDGALQGAAFGFGMTMLGVTVDYPVLLIGHRKRTEPALATLRRIGPTLTLAVLAAALGLTGMVFCGFPGLAQIGLFSVVGVLAAAGITGFILPHLIVAADLAPVWSDNAAPMHRIEWLRHYRGWLAVPLLGAALLLIWHPPRWQNDLARLSPVSAEDTQLDLVLRSELGAAPPNRVLIVQAASAEAVLRREEELAPQLEQAEYAARLLPSLEKQRARQAMLPDALQLAQAIAAARIGTPFTPDAFTPFERAVASSRTLPLITPDRITAPGLSTRLTALLAPDGAGWAGWIVPRHNTALPALSAPDVLTLDMHDEANRLVGGATARAWRWLALGGVLVVAVVAAGLRDKRRILRVLASVASALLVTIAALSATGTRFSLLHIVALQFVAGISLDYALFFARRQLDDEERARTMRTLVTCNALTLATFGMLACCRTILLREIGLTVAIGAFSAMVISFLLAGDRPNRMIET